MRTVASTAAFEKERVSSEVQRTVSIVVPVFNREDWVAEAIDSVLHQDCGLDRLDVVLVDDGSTDGSPEILDRYASLHPGIVNVVHKENGGVATALNAGVEAARGDIVGFLGSDDYLSSDTVSNVLTFFDEHWDEIDLAAIPIYMTGAKEGPHWNNRSRFAQTRVIDVSVQWNLRQISGGGSFIKRSIFSNLGYAFDPALFITEDATLNTEVIMRRMAYGVISKPVYFNRRYKQGDSSLVASSHYRKDFYTVIPEHSYIHLLGEAHRRFGYVPKYVQAVCVYDLIFRFRQDTSVLTDMELAEYVALLQRILKHIDTDVLMAQSATIEQRLSMLDLKFDNRLEEALVYSKGLFTVQGCRVYGYGEKRRGRHRAVGCTIEDFDHREGRLRVRGTLRALQMTGDVSFAVKVGSRRFPLTLLDPMRPGPEMLSMRFSSGARFDVEVPYRVGQKVQLVAIVEPAGGPVYEGPMVLLHNRFDGFAGNAQSGFFMHNGDVVFRQDSERSVESYSVPGRIGTRAELGFLRRAKQAGASIRALAKRLSARRARRRAEGEVWLMADHKREAGDNAEALFRYLTAHPETGITPVLMLSRGAPHYDELADLGEVVEPDSRRFWTRYFQAAVVLNSAADEYMINPLEADLRWLGDLLPPLSVFLQHGVTKDDQSSWLNRPRKGFDVFVTSGGREQESIVNGPYGYRADEVALVGMPRFDRLENEVGRVVVFAPTWRRQLVGPLDPQSGRNDPNDEFEDSQFFKEWQSVISDPILNEALLAAGYTGLFALHPSHSAELAKFTPGSRVQIADYPFDYRNMLRRGSVLVTDYSSVAFDFAYLRKPVLYLQSDREDFFGGHLYKPGYFSYEQDGFGPVLTDAPSLIDTLVHSVRNDARSEPAYASRADDFFAFSGGGNCERLVEHIRSVQSERGSTQ